MTNVVKKIQNTVFQHSLFKRGDKIVLAVSGGPDSSTMLDVFSKLGPKYDLNFVIAHVNYGLRKKESDKDEKFVLDLGAKYDIPVEVLKPKISSNSNLEENLRNIRYTFFEKVRTKYSFSHIAVAHNANDQVETYLMRVLRGAGLLGLSSMKYKAGNIIRPLLDITRKEILTYLKSKNLHYRVDKTNLESVFFRNKIRNKLIPYLTKNFNPKLQSTICDSVTAINSDYELIDALGKEAYKKNKDLSVRKLLKLHESLQRRVILEAIREKRGNLRNIQAAHIGEILKIAKSTKSKSHIVILLGLKIRRNGDKITIELTN